jgi:hypothetical protein
MITTGEVNIMEMNDFEYVTIMNTADAKLHSVGLDKLNDAEKVIALFSIGRFEISTGGLDTFYYNSAGDYAVETAWAFEMIGAAKAADVLRRANALFPDGTPPRDGDERFDALQIIREHEDALETLTGEFYDADNAENTDKLIEDFILLHRDELPNV